MKAFITGITGQDGSYLADLLIEKGYEVHGLIRRASTFNTSRIDHLFKDPHDQSNKLHLHYGDMTDSSGLTNLIREIEPDEIYNLAAQSHVMVSFTMPTYTAHVDAIGTVALLEAIRSSKINTRFYQASTSELYGKVQEVPQTEKTPFYPRSPYGVAKLYAFWIVKNYREAYGMFASNGILFNHESPRRGHNFVTRKVTIGLGKILRGENDKLVMGNLDSMRDWGHAKDYVEGMWRVLQHTEADDFVLSSNEMHSVKEFIEKAFALKGFQIQWTRNERNVKNERNEIKNELNEEVGIDSITGKTLIVIDAKYFRHAEVEQLLGDSTKARTLLGWKPVYTFDQLVKEMVDHDCD